MQRVKMWLLAFRPKTLTASLVPIISSTALLSALGFHLLWPQWEIVILALLSSLCIQIGTNLVNDAMDFKKGADTDTRKGPQRVTHGGFFSANRVLAMGTAFFSLALVCGIPLVYWGGPPILWIGTLSILCGYAYTAGPFPLAYRGFGDVFVILFFGLIAVSGLLYLQIHEWRWEALILGLQVGCHCTVLIAINNLRDMEEDKLVHKNTLAVRLGRRFACYEIGLLIFVPYVLLLYWVQLGFTATLLSLLSLPLAIRLLWRIVKTEPSPAYNGFLAQAAGLHMAFAILLSVGLLL